MTGYAKRAVVRNALREHAEAVMLDFVEPTGTASGSPSKGYGSIIPNSPAALLPGVADRRLPPYLEGMKFSIGYFARPRAPGVPPALLATHTGDFNTVDAARKAAIADADNPEIGAVDSITIDPIGERWVKGESLIRTGSGWERRREPE